MERRNITVAMKCTLTTAPFFKAVSLDRVVLNMNVIKDNERTSCTSERNENVNAIIHKRLTAHSSTSNIQQNLYISFFKANFNDIGYNLEAKCLSELEIRLVHHNISTQLLYPAAKASKTSTSLFRVCWLVLVWSFLPVYTSYLLIAKS